MQFYLGEALGKVLVEKRKETNVDYPYTSCAACAAIVWVLLTAEPSDIMHDFQYSNHYNYHFGLFIIIISIWLLYFL